MNKLIEQKKAVVEKKFEIAEEKTKYYAILLMGQEVFELAQWVFIVYVGEGMKVVGVYYLGKAIFVSYRKVKRGE